MRLATVLFCLGVTAAFGETLPERRPALVGSGADSLVNLIDTQGLMQKGQRDAWVMFRCVVGPDGKVGEVLTFRVSPEAELLKHEVSRTLRKARFIAPVNKHHWTYASVSGTVIFFISKGQPRLRVYENQEMDELKRGSDFIAPQPVYVPNSPPSLVSYPGHADSLSTPGTVTLRHSVDANGKTTDVKVVKETPAGEHFGDAALAAVREIDFLPAYRNGKPTASTLTVDFRFLVPGR
ncbi:MAG: energy transducer TonB [Chthoniobacterales bacterium]